ncbi:MAG: SUMF1/EgtB/PvdO family nonheme iron enzyme, partial [Anaerolineales bacterium]|nr:SUMF1/EgtB/PvdO family nonheme iron enzyme [Anaerolineales bacterium]
KAARGVGGRQYPWGNQFEAGRLNSAEGEQVVQATTPVGIYTGGVSPFGAFDCAGNVWEWCATQAPGYELKPYPYHTAEDEWAIDYLNRTNIRALRGGSWDLSEDDARCVCRYRNNPHLRNYSIGCRLAASPIG